jgi:hypothetical protein
MATFGRNSTSTTYTTIENQLTGALFTLTEPGKLTTITGDINVTTAAKNGKFLIHRHSNSAYMGETAQASWAIGHLKRTNNFTVPLKLPLGDYILTAWCASGSGNGQISYATGATNQGHYDPATYGTTPNPMVPTHNNYAYNIYATYTPIIQEGSFFTRIFSHQDWVTCPICETPVNLTTSLPTFASLNINSNQPMALTIPTHKIAGSETQCVSSTQLATNVAVYTDTTGVFVKYSMVVIPDGWWNK